MESIVDFDKKSKEIDNIIKDKGDKSVLPEYEAVEDKTMEVNVMDDGMKLYVDIIKKETVDTLESGAIPEVARQIAFIEEQLVKLLTVGNVNYTKVIGSYFGDRDKLKSAKFEADKKFEEEYSKNVKDVYENFIKKL